MFNNTSVFLAILLTTALGCCLEISTARKQNKPEINHTIHELTVPILENATFQLSMIPREYQHLALVSKCCKLNEFLSKKDLVSEAECLKNDTAYKEFSPLFHDFNVTGVVDQSYEMTEFVVLINDPCRHKRYMLEPDINSEDEYYLLYNGTVYAPHHIPLMLIPGVDYCMEVVPSHGLTILVCFAEELELPKANFLITLYTCGLLISVLFLLLTIAAYLVTPELQDLHGLALCCYCGCLELAFMGLAIAQLASADSSSDFCNTTAFVIQFSFMACFFWLNVMCVETYMLVHRHTKGKSIVLPDLDKKRVYFYYSLWAWGPTALLISVSLYMEFSPMVPATYLKSSFEQNSCWFNSDEGAKLYFYVPISLLVCINLVLFGLTALEIIHYQRKLELRQLATDGLSEHKERRLFKRLKRIVFVCLGLFFLMGINWVLELASWWAGGSLLTWTAFDLINAFQGVLVFGIFVLRPPLRTIIWCNLVRRLKGQSPFQDQGVPMDTTFFLLGVMDSMDLQMNERIS